VGPLKTILIPKRVSIFFKVGLCWTAPRLSLYVS